MNTIANEQHRPKPKPAPDEAHEGASKPKRGGQRKPVSLAPMTVDEALQRTFAAGPMPKKPRKRKATKQVHRTEQAKDK